MNGYELIIRPSDGSERPANCLPEGWTSEVTCKPFIHTRKRQTLQYVSPAIDEVVRMLEQALLDPAPRPDTMKGTNYRPSPCTDYGMQVLALRDRQRIMEGRPWVIEPRHLKGVRKCLDDLYVALDGIIAAKARREGRSLKGRPDYMKKAQSYTGSKRRHYEDCAKELELHPLHLRRREIYHECSGKWGELSERPRVLLVQTVRSRGTPSVRAGTPLRAPILVEGCYRGEYEDALHHYKHARGHRFVASGSSLRDRGKFIKETVEPGDLVLSLDWSSFDGSLGQLGVEERNMFLTHATRLFGRNAELDAVIATQNLCTVQGGPIRAKLYGNRGSGTAGTSTGNKCVVLACIAYCLGPAFGGRRGVRLYCDGDDTLIFVPSHWRVDSDRWVKSWCRRFTALGLQTKVQQAETGHPADVAETIRFCRAGVITTETGPVLCKEPLDALYVFTNFRKHFRGPRFRDYLQTLSVGVRNTYGEVPVLSAFADFFCVGGRVDASLLDSSGIEYMMANRSAKASTRITQAARDSFHRTFGLPPEKQLAAEALIRAEAPHFKALL